MGLRFGFSVAFLGVEDGGDGKGCPHSAEYKAREPWSPLNMRIMAPKKTDLAEVDAGSMI
jgi:hypothetical protein